MDETSPRWPILLGFILSLLVHLGAIAALRRASAAHPLQASQPSQIPQPDPTKLGIERSTASTVAWIGYDQYLEHVARPAPNDQAAMAPPSGASSPAPPDAAPATSPQASAQPQPDDVQPLELLKHLAALPQPEAPASSPLEPDPILPSEEDPLALAPLAGGAQPQPSLEPAEHLLQGVEGPPAPPTTKQPRATAAPSQPATEPDTSKTPPSPRTKPLPQSTSAEKESQAFSIRKAPRVIPGRPLAAHGLNIITTIPDWTHFTSITAHPRDAIVEIRFDRTGAVSKAILLRSSGRADVDGPLLDAVYNWTAKGEAIQKLPEPRAGHIKKTVNIVLRIALR